MRLTLTLGTILNRRNVIKMLIICVRFLRDKELDMSFVDCFSLFELKKIKQEPKLKGK